MQLFISFTVCMIWFSGSFKSCWAPSYSPRKCFWIRHSARVSTELDDWLSSNGSITFKNKLNILYPSGTPCIQKRISCLKSMGMPFRTPFHCFDTLTSDCRPYIPLLQTWHGMRDWYPRNIKEAENDIRNPCRDCDWVLKQWVTKWDSRPSHSLNLLFHSI